MLATTISSAEKGASFLVVQGACEKFFRPETETKYNVHPYVFFGSYQPKTEVTTQKDWLRFQDLATAWRQQRGATSSSTMAAMCPAYQAIIGMGKLAVPFLLSTLRAEGTDPDHWFWALKAITGVDPVKEEDRGRLRAMAKAWLSWGTQQGYGR